jgi:tetratricopeptide (TPR) repeat protein
MALAVASLGLPLGAAGCGEVLASPADSPAMATADRPADATQVVPAEGSVASAEVVADARRLLMLSAAPEDRERVGRQRIEAARELSRLGEHALAQELLSQALEDHADATEPQDLRTRASIRLAIASTAWRLGDHETVIREARRVLEASPEAVDAPRAMATHQLLVRSLIECDRLEQALEELWPHWQAIYNRIGRERGWPAVTHRDFLAAASPTGALYVGSPETVAKKIATTATTLSLSRFDLKYSSATLPHDKMLESIHLYGTQVAPMVRELIKAPQPVA